MVTKKKSAAGKAKSGRPILKKETIKDLDVKSKEKNVRGGRAKQWTTDVTTTSLRCTANATC
jgi:hypothetical protein